MLSIFDKLPISLSLSFDKFYFYLNGTRSINFSTEYRKLELSSETCSDNYVSSSIQTSIRDIAYEAKK